MPLVPVRRLNIVFNFAAALWYVSGRDNLDFIAYYAPSMRRYSADGVLVRRGDAAVCLDNLTTGRLANVESPLCSVAFTFVECDIVKTIDIGAPVDVVVHLARPASPPDYLEPFHLDLESLGLQSGRGWPVWFRAWRSPW